MPDQTRKRTRSGDRFVSDRGDDVWHDRPEAGSLESWHFDALSDDGREALLISFFDNYPFSPRYFLQKNGRDTADLPNLRFPSVSLTYFVDGKVSMHSVNEYTPQKFSAGTSEVCCTIGDSSFCEVNEEYGSGYRLVLDLLTPGKRTIHAELEWISVESDLMHAEPRLAASEIGWNLVAPRLDVSGRLTLAGRRGNIRKTIHFRGTGYHDHFQSIGPLYQTVKKRIWGRAHFTDLTAIFQASSSPRGERLDSLYIITGNKLGRVRAFCRTDGVVRNFYGLEAPQSVSFIADSQPVLTIKPTRIARSGFCDLTLVADMALDLPNEKPRRTTGLTHLWVPGRLRNRIIRWASEPAIGKDGKAPWL